METQNKEDKVWVTIDRTINLGNYENLKISAGLSRTIQEGENPDELLTSVCEEVFDTVKIESKRFKRTLKKE